MAAHLVLKPRYTGYSAAVRELSVRARAPFSGLKPTLVGIVPYTGLSFGIFESLKQIVQDPSRKNLDHIDVSGAVAGLGAIT